MTVLALGGPQAALAAAVDVIVVEQQQLTTSWGRLWGRWGCCVFVLFWSAFDLGSSGGGGRDGIDPLSSSFSFLLPSISFFRYCHAVFLFFLRSLWHIGLHEDKNQGIDHKNEKHTRNENITRNVLLFVESLKPVQLSTDEACW